MSEEEGSVCRYPRQAPALGQGEGPQMPTVSISPAAVGWVVCGPGLAGQYILKGSAAEASALKLAKALAQNDPVWLEIYLRDGCLARRHLILPQPSPQSGASERFAA